MVKFKDEISLTMVTTGINQSPVYYERIILKTISTLIRVV